MATLKQIYTDFDSKRSSALTAEAAQVAAQKALADATAAAQAADSDEASALTVLTAKAPENVPYLFTKDGKPVVVINLHGEIKELAVGDPDVDLDPPAPPAPEPAPAPGA